MRKRANGKKLLVVFLRGGNDALNTVIPVESSQYQYYQSYRPTLAVPLNQILPSRHAEFGLHPSLAPLQAIHQNGSLSFVHCVGYPNPDRSHFESMAFLETAVPGNTLLDGWINRYLQATSGPGNVRGLAIGSTAPASVLGPIPVPVSTNFGDILIKDDTLGPDDPPPGSLQQKLEALYALSPTPHQQNVYETGRSLVGMVDSFSERHLDSYLPNHGAVYPDTWFGNKIKHAAQMFRETPTPLNIEIITVDMDGYDTHAQQTDTTYGHPALLDELARSLAAFHTDMGPLMNDHVVLVVSEFGRRSYENDSSGTDHGTGSVAMVMGASVQGDVFCGSGWPGLAPGNLFEGEDLDWTVDFRDIYWEILKEHMGLDPAALSQIIPGHVPTPIGFFT
jgi:uncharacterized protein (DUF1501 family)